MEGWREQGREFPPYIAYLSLFVLAAGLEGDFAPNAYYPRLRTLLGEAPTIGTYPSFGRMFELWSDLEKWANEERAGELGVLRTDIAGAWLHVGLPIAQAILTEAERQHLHKIFSQANLDPEYPPTDMELAQLVHAHAGYQLRPRTRRALEDVRSEYGAVLIDRILEELESWDGTLEPVAGGDRGDAVERGAAIICLPVLDEITQRVASELRCRFPEPFPDSVTITVAGKQYTCGESADGYSTAFATEVGERLHVTGFDWARTILLDAGGGHIIRLPGAPVRVFVDGSDRGLPGYVEVPSLDPSRSFLLAVAPQVAAAVEVWGAQSCTGFRELRITGGPDGWRFFVATRALDDAIIRDQLPRLSFSKELRRIRLVGGIRVPGKQSYFRFAPPTIQLDGGADVDAVEINGVRVTRDKDASFNIPDDLLAETIIVISAGNVRRVVYLQDSGGGPEWPVRAYRPDGSAAPADEATLPCGVEMSDVARALGNDLFPPLADGVRVFVIGQRPGEIATSSVEIPFTPVWLLLQRGREKYQVRYVAPSLLEPLRTTAASRKACREWKDLLCYQRKRMEPPSFEPLRKLWERYQEAARHA